MSGEHAPMRDFGGLTGRVAGAPISWGVCEVPGWGLQLRVEQVLTEMVQVGLVATELGPDGFLPTDPHEARGVLDRYRLDCVGGFMPVRLHAEGSGDRDDPIATEIAARIRQLLACGGDTLVLAADTGADSYDGRPQLDDDGWRRLLARLDLAARMAADAGLAAVLHPHVGTMVETADDVDRVVSGSRIGLCLDTGHLFIGGADVHALAELGRDRIGHVHLKDVRRDLADRVREGDVAYGRAVKDGLYTPLGDGDVGIAEVVTSLEEAGYKDWYVLEQDVVLTEDSPSPIDGVVRSLDFLAEVAGAERDDEEEVTR